MPCASQAQRDAFEQDGFVIFDKPLLSPDVVQLLRARLEKVYAGDFSTGTAPDKAPVARKPTQTLHGVNVWKCDAAFAEAVLSEELGELVASIAGWRGVRLLQDQLWAKPPGAGPVAFHRDESYMGEGVVTLWITLDDVRPDMGGLQYARGSHRWPGEVNAGFVPFLYDRKTWKQCLNDHAKRNDTTADLAPVLVSAGCGSMHTGKTFHGSDSNRSATAPRRGLGLHLVAVDATAHEGDPRWRTWKKYLSAPGAPLPDEHFPILWQEAPAVLA